MIDTHNKLITFGKHRGERWTRLPVSYLRWLANESHGDAKEMAESELKRRGTTIPSDIELSGHAIDRASQITKEWQEEGVHSWLVKMAEEAMATPEGVVLEDVIVHKGYKFVFAYGSHYPILKTIMLKNEKAPVAKTEAPVGGGTEVPAIEPTPDNSGTGVPVPE